MSRPLNSAQKSVSRLFLFQIPSFSNKEVMKTDSAIIRFSEKETQNRVSDFRYLLRFKSTKI